MSTNILLVAIQFPDGSFLCYSDAVVEEQLLSSPEPHPVDYAQEAAERWAALLDHVDQDIIGTGIIFERLSRHHEVLLARAIDRYRHVGVRGMEDFRFLALLRRNADGDLSITEASRALRITKASTSARVERLVEAGIVTRSNAIYDRRIVTIALAPSKANLVDEIFRSVSAVHQMFFAPLDRQELIALRSALTAIRSHLQN